MRILLLVLGSICFGALALVVGFWYLQPLLSRQFVLRRLSKPKLTAKPSNDLNLLTELSELLDTTARNLRLGKSMASSLHSAVKTNVCKISVVGDLATATTGGESFSDATKKLLAGTNKSELAFALRTIELAATGGVGGVLALERAAIVLRERSTNIHDRQAQSAQAMLSTKVLSWAPVAVCGWLIVTSEAVRQFLIFSATGWFCILLGFSFNYAGRKWMQAIVSPTPT